MEELSLQDIISILLSKIWAIVLSILIGAVSALVISSYIIAPTYQSRLSLYVFNAETASKEKTNNDLLMAQRLVNSYMAVLQSDKFLNKVIYDAGLDTTPKILKEHIKMSAITDTELFEIIVSAHSPSLAFRIASSFTKLAPSGVEQIVKTGRTEVVDVPALAEKPSSPNILLNTVIGALLGLVASCMIILVMDMIDIKIKSKEEITAKYSVPVLGSIPLHSEDKKRWKK
ncbi:MAG: hypothetical protein J6C55_04715 [Oscillospiraceae bacterium]|nr:hypothetical protein [Oscillospiraceae bacterium]